MQNEALLNFRVHLGLIIEARLAAGHQFALRILLEGREQILKVMAPIQRRSCGLKFDALRNVIAQSVLDLRDEKAREPLGV